MTSQTKLGLLAFGCVFGLAALATAGIFAVRVAGGHGVGIKAEAGPGGDAKSVADRPVSTGDAKDDESYILGHRWWSKAMSRDQLEAIVRRSVSLNRGKAAVVERGGTLLEDADIHAGDVLFDAGGKKAFAVTGRWAARPTRTEVLSAVRRELDRLEYKDGPGR